MKNKCLIKTKNKLQNLVIELREKTQKCPRLPAAVYNFYIKKKKKENINK